MHEVSIQVLWCFSAPWLQHVQYDATLLECLICIDISSLFSKLPSYRLTLQSKPLNHIVLQRDYNPALNMFEMYHNIPIWIAFMCLVCACAAILSALKNLQEKIRRLELEKGREELSLRSKGKDATHKRLQSDTTRQRLINTQTDTRREPSDESNCNQGEYRHT